MPGVENIFRDSSGAMGLSTWQTLGQDLNSITDDLNFTNPAEKNLRLLDDSSCINTGAVDVLAWCRIDADNWHRGTQPSIGAYEFMDSDPSNPCQVDLDSDGDVDGVDIVMFSADLDQSCLNQFVLMFGH